MRAFSKVGRQLSQAVNVALFLPAFFLLSFFWGPNCNNRTSDKHQIGPSFFLPTSPAKSLSTYKAPKTPNPFSKIIKSLENQTTSQNFFCPCCGWSGSNLEWAGFGAAKRRCKCPVCDSRERHRLACLELSNEALVATDLPHSFRLLHFGAQKHMEKQINKMSEVDQVSVDYFYPGYNYSDLVLKAQTWSFLPTLRKGLLFCMCLSTFLAWTLRLESLSGFSIRRAG